MTLQQAILLNMLIAKSRRIELNLKEEVAVLEDCGLYEEAKQKAMLRVTHIKRIIRYQQTLIQHQA